MFIELKFVVKRNVTCNTELSTGAVVPVDDDAEGPEDPVEDANPTYPGNDCRPTITRVPSLAIVLVAVPQFESLVLSSKVASRSIAQKPALSFALAPEGRVVSIIVATILSKSKPFNFVLSH